MPHNRPHLQYRPDIDGLRALAVLSVVFYHCFPDAIRGGFAGVDVFFVISGFLISTILFKNIDRGSFSLADFYSRRIRRIFPALAVVLFSVLVFGWFHLFPDELQQLGKHAASSAGFLQNFTLWKESGYFDNASETKPLLHIWSLGIEEQFYFIWPLLLWGAGKLGELSSRGTYKKLFYLVSILSVFIVSFVLNVNLIETDRTKTFYLPQYRFFELAIGGLVAWLVLYKFISFDVQKRFVPNVLSFLGLAGLLIVFGQFNKQILFPGKMALIPVLATAFIILAGANAWLNRTILSHRIFVWFGLISFPLYLWHWPILSFGRIVFGQTPTPEFRLLAVATSILFAWLTVRLIENPFRFGGRNAVKVSVLVALIVGLAVSGRVISKYDWVVSGLPLSKFTGVMNYKYQALPGETKCEGTEFISDTLNYCLKYPHRPGPYDAVIIGDSHAGDKFHGIAKLGTDHNWLLLANSSCPPVYGIRITVSDKQICPHRMESAIDYVSANNSIKKVVLSFAATYFQTEPVAANHLGGEMARIFRDEKEMQTLSERAAAFAWGLENTLAKLQHKKVYVLVDVPELPFYPRDCLRGFRSCSIKRSAVEARQKLLREMLASLKVKFPQITIFDPIDFICGTEECSYQKDGVFFYRDGHHLSLEGSDAYAKKFLF